MYQTAKYNTMFTGLTIAFTKKVKNKNLSKNVIMRMNYLFLLMYDKEISHECCVLCFKDLDSTS